MHHEHPEDGVGINPGKYQQASPEAVHLHQFLHHNGIQHRPQADQGLGEAHPHDTVLDEIMIECRVAGGHHQAEGQSLDEAEGHQQVHRRGGKHLEARSQEVQYTPEDANLSHPEALEQRAGEQAGEAHRREEGAGYDGHGTCLRSNALQEVSKNQAK